MFSLGRQCQNCRVATSWCPKIAWWYGGTLPNTHTPMLELGCRTTFTGLLCFLLYFLLRKTVTVFLIIFVTNTFDNLMKIKNPLLRKRYVKHKTAWIFREFVSFSEIHPCIQQGSVDFGLRVPARMHCQPSQVGWDEYSLIKEMGNTRHRAHSRALWDAAFLPIHCVC